MAQFGDPDVHFKWNNHQGDLFRKFHLLFEEERLVDVTLTAGQQSLKAHRLILAASSQYFEDLFSLPQSDDTSEMAEINLSGHIQFEDLQVLVDYMYRGEISVPRDQLPSLLVAASQLKIRDNSIEHGQVQELLFNHGKSSDSINPLQLSNEVETNDSRSEFPIDAARFNRPETGLMEDGKGDYNVTFVEPADKHQFTDMLETVIGDPLLRIEDDDSTSDTSADEIIDPGWDDGVLPLTRAQFLEAKAEYLAQKSHSVAFKLDEAQEDTGQNEERMEERNVSEHIEPSEIDYLSSRDDDDGDANSSKADSDVGQYEERMEESDVSEHIEPNETDHLSSRDDDDGDANLSAADSYDEEDQEEEDEEYVDASAWKSQQSSSVNDSDDSTYGEKSSLDYSRPSSKSSDEDFIPNISAAGPSKRKRKRSATSSSKSNRYLNNESLLECRNCRKLFKTNGDAFQLHMELCEVAEPPRQFPCQVCDKNFSRKYHLQRHLIRVHFIEPSHLANYGAGNRIKPANPDSTAHSSISSSSFACKRCGLSYKSEESLRRHLEDECINEGPSYHCSQCDYWSKRLDNLNNHVKIQHEEYGSILSL